MDAALKRDRLLISNSKVKEEHSIVINEDAGNTTSECLNRTSFPRIQEQPTTVMENNKLPMADGDRESQEVEHSLSAKTLDSGHDQETLILDTPPSSLPASSPSPSSSEQSVSSNDRASSSTPESQAKAKVYDDKSSGNNVSDKRQLNRHNFSSAQESNCKREEQRKQEDMIHNESETTASLVSFEVDDIDGIEFKSFESEEDLEKFTENELKILQELNRRTAKKAKQFSKTSKPNAPSAFMSSSLDDILAEAKNSCLSLEGTAPPKTSKIYDMGVLAREGMKHLQKSLPSSTWTPTAAAVEASSSQNNVSEGDFDSASGFSSSLIKQKRKYVRTKPYVNWRWLKNSRQQQGQSNSVSNNSFDQSNNNVVITELSSPKDLKQKRIIRLKKSKHASDFTREEKENAFIQRIIETETIQRNEAKNVHVSILMDKSYIDFALESLDPSLSKPESSTSKRGRKRKVEEEDEDEIDSHRKKGRKPSQRMADDIGIANMISRHSGRSVRLPARYHGNVVGNLGVIPESPVVEKPHGVITEKKAKKILMEKQKKLAVIKSTFKDASPLTGIQFEDMMPSQELSSTMIPPITVPRIKFHRKKERLAKSSHLPMKQLKFHASDPLSIASEVERQRQQRMKKMLMQKTSMGMSGDQVTLTKRQEETIRENACFRQLEQQLIDFDPSRKKLQSLIPPSPEKVANIKELQRRICESDAFRRHLESSLQNKDKLLQQEPPDLKTLPSNPEFHQLLKRPAESFVTTKAPIKSPLRQKCTAFVFRDGGARALHNYTSLQHLNEVTNSSDVVTLDSSTPSSSQPTDLRELYRQLYLMNDPKRENHYKKQGIKPRVNKLDAVQEAIDVIAKLETRKHKNEYLRTLFMLWNEKLRKCVNVIEERVPASLKSSPASKKRTVQVVEEVFNAYLKSCCYKFSQSDYFTKRRSRGKDYFSEYPKQLNLVILEKLLTCFFLTFFIETGKQSSESRSFPHKTNQSRNSRGSQASTSSLETSHNLILPLTPNSSAMMQDPSILGIPEEFNTSRRTT
jgi:hypothetical protein